MKTLLILIAVAAGFAASTSCAPRRSTSLLQDNSKTWADTPVSLAQPQDRYVLMLQSFSPVNQIGSQTKFSLFAVNERLGEKGRKLGVYYVDLASEGTDQLATYTSEVELSVYGTSVDVYLNLYKASPTYNRLLYQRGQGGSATKIYLGNARFTGSRIARIQQTSGLRIDLVNSEKKKFKGNGQAGVHFLSNVNYTTPQVSLECVDTGGCTALPFEEICSRITEEGCYPTNATDPAVGDFALKGKTKNLDELTAGFWLYKPGSTARITFVSANISATDADNEKLCNDLATFVITSGFDNRRNDTCQLARYPSTKPTDGKLTCSVEVAFTEPYDVSEYSCDVTVVFLGSNKELQKARLLYGAGE